MNQDQQLREQLVKLIQGGQAFYPPDRILEGISFEKAGEKPEGLPYTLWQLMEHMRIALWDILEFSRDPSYQSPKWPDGYWPNESAPENQTVLDHCRQSIAKGLEEMIQLVSDNRNDLYAPFAHGDGQNLLREAMLVGEHNAYHLCQIVVARRLLGDWV